MTIDFNSSWSSTSTPRSEVFDMQGSLRLRLSPKLSIDSTPHSQAERCSGCSDPIDAPSGVTANSAHTCSSANTLSVSRPSAAAPFAALSALRALASSSSSVGDAFPPIPVEMSVRCLRPTSILFQEAAVLSQGTQCGTVWRWYRNAGGSTLWVHCLVCFCFLVFSTLDN